MGKISRFVSNHLEGILGLYVVGGVAILGCLVAKDTRDRDKMNAEIFRESEIPMVAEVLEETYENRLSPVEKWEGVVSYSNPTVKLDSKYTLKCKVGNRVLGLSVVDGGSVSKESLDKIIKVGSMISFPKGNAGRNEYGSYINMPEETYFQNDTQAGSKRADRIRVLNAE